MASVDRPGSDNPSPTSAVNDSAAASGQGTSANVNKSESSPQNTNTNIIAPEIHVHVPAPTPQSAREPRFERAGSTGVWLAQQSAVKLEAYLDGIRPEVAMQFTGGREVSIEIRTKGVNAVSLYLRVRSPRFAIEKWYLRDTYWAATASSSYDLLRTTTDFRRKQSFELLGRGRIEEAVLAGYPELMAPMEIDVRCECTPYIEPEPSLTASVHYEKGRFNVRELTP